MRRDKGWIVNDGADRENFVMRLGRLTADTKTAIYAWTLMNKHAHILFAQRGNGSFPFYASVSKLVNGHGVALGQAPSRVGVSTATV